MQKVPTFALLVAAVLLPLLLPAQAAAPNALLRLVQTERSFARRATAVGWRDAFLEFFADDAIALVPEPAPAKDRLRKQPSRPFSVFELEWEPRTGEIAASGELGWLTGPSTSLDRSAANPKPGYGNYLSIWRRQPDGQWRVFIDIGATIPEPAAFAPGFNRFSFERAYSGKAGHAESLGALLAADRELNGRLPSGVAQAYGEMLAPAARLHRMGQSPAVGREAAMTWLAAHAPSMPAITGNGDAAESGDLGYSYGTYTAAAGAKPGPYLRVWQRTAAGRWLIVADVER
ncbi:MAG: hypothetical protein A3H96_07040 [Acidobacteria bacterium RIFCSPLOWO2_02_FULL_67_36]|nr:MAG: hypothetical protein A3H96_07040 [Acidobacteria bacterium RIFCSPLOWO2_02_FULL_67_36]OFW26519.1 MAG: hypothetical protein A3G21_24280 [Acidobacteria bacterium RIFCSPLOWO2_12_FULL_66_21]